MNEKDTMKHNETKLPLDIQTFRLLFNNWNEKQRLEIVKSLIWTSIDQYKMREEILKTLNDENFFNTFD